MSVRAGLCQWVLLGLALLGSNVAQRVPGLIARLIRCMLPRLWRVHRACLYSGGAGWCANERIEEKFGDNVMCLPAAFVGQSKFDVRWMDGVWLGSKSGSKGQRRQKETGGRRKVEQPRDRWIQRCAVGDLRRSSRGFANKSIGLTVG